MSSDDELLAAHARGEPGVFDVLVKRYQGPLTGFLRKMTTDEALAEDAVIETFLKVHRAAASYESNGHFKTWLYTVAYREGVTLLRRRNKGVHRHEKSLDDVASAARCRQPTPEQTLSEKQSLEAVEAVLDTVPEVQRAVFILFYTEHMSTADIAEAVDIPPGSVRAYLSMVRKAIRLALPERPWGSGEVQ